MSTGAPSPALRVGEGRGEGACAKLCVGPAFARVSVLAAQSGIWSTARRKMRYARKVLLPVERNGSATPPG